MKNFSSKAVIAFCLLGLSVPAIAGNKDRTGQAGATELLINPWAQSTGVFGMNTAYVSGVEAMKNNMQSDWMPAVSNALGKWHDDVIACQRSPFNSHVFDEV